MQGIIDQKFTTTIFLIYFLVGVAMTEMGIENRSCIVCNEGIPKSKESRTSSGLAVHQECFKCKDSLLHCFSKRCKGTHLFLGDDCGNEAEKSSLRLSQDKFYCTEHFPSKDEEDDNSQSSVRLYSEERNESEDETLHLTQSTEKLVDSEETSEPTCSSVNSNDSGVSKNESIEEEAEENRPKKRKITIRKVKSSFNDPQTNMVVSGILPAKFAGTEEGEMSVTARVTDLEKWKSLEGVKHHTEIRMPSKGPGELYLVTGRVKMSEAKNVNSQDFVKSFKVSRKLMPQRA